nr:MAG TPA: hypothetical protein [Caudoviricetes sp.]
MAYASIKIPGRGNIAPRAGSRACAQRYSRLHKIYCNSCIYRVYFNLYFT